MGLYPSTTRQVSILSPEWFVYVIQSLAPRFSKSGKRLPGFFYVGSTTDYKRRLREHNGLFANGSPGNSKGGKYTAQHRNWEMMAIYGPYANRSEAFKAEMTLKHGKRGVARTQWDPTDSEWCRGLGSEDPRVAEINEAMHQWLLAKSATDPDSPPRP